MVANTDATSEACDAYIELIDAALPQTQCGRCGYPACRPYAAAIADGAAPINRCAPGGVDGIRRLARVTGQAEIPLDPEYGMEETPSRVARIDEDACIGCTKCIQACPVDAIVGARKLLHTVVADRCTGCELCVAPCPVDCIAMVPAPDRLRWGKGDPAVQQRADLARKHSLARNARLAREPTGRGARRRDARDPGPASTAPITQTISKQEVLAAIARGRAKRLRSSSTS